MYQPTVCIQIESNHAYSAKFEIRDNTVHHCDSPPCMHANRMDSANNIIDRITSVGDFCEDHQVHFEVSSTSKLRELQWLFYHGGVHSVIHPLGVKTNNGSDHHGRVHFKVAELQLALNDLNQTDVDEWGIVRVGFINNNGSHIVSECFITLREDTMADAPTDSLLNQLSKAGLIPVGNGSELDPTVARMRRNARFRRDLLRPNTTHISERPSITDILKRHATMNRRTCCYCFSFGSYCYGLWQIVRREDTGRENVPRPLNIYEF
eukprot:912630_1